MLRPHRLQRETSTIFFIGFILNAHYAQHYYFYAKIKNEQEIDEWFLVIVDLFQNLTTWGCDLFFVFLLGVSTG